LIGASKFHKKIFIKKDFEKCIANSKGALDKKAWKAFNFFVKNEN